MKPTRRDILGAGTAALLAGATTGCEKLVSLATQQLGESIPDTITPPAGIAIDPVHHLLNRAAFGPWPGDVERVRAMGTDAWIEQQLWPDSIDDTACDLRAEEYVELDQQSGECYEYDKPVLREDMARHTLQRAVYSKRQLLEVMAGFWTDHLNINIEKGDCIYLKPADDRFVVRKHALGNFSDLIRASVTSPAMLVYLDNSQNRGGESGARPNENYARELLELHTLGVGGGYTQRDVFEAARALTGWRMATGFRIGTAYFDPAVHDDGEKHVLGQRIAAHGGASDIDRLVEIVTHHPSTARHIATKMVRRLVSEEEPKALIDRVATVFANTDGDIRQMVRTILKSDEFAASAGSKFKTPLQYVASSLRILGADTYAHGPLIEYLVRMGQGVFQYPTPDGYPDKTSPWLGTLLWRWNFAFTLAANQAPSVTVSLDAISKALAPATDELTTRWFRHVAGHDPTPAQRSALASASGPDLVGLLLSSPSFQRY